MHKYLNKASKKKIVITGGKGTDTITTGSGSDIIEIAADISNLHINYTWTDNITDFSTGSNGDKIRFLDFTK